MGNLKPRIAIAALKGGSGKTIFSLGLTAAWHRKGVRVSPFKKGPDFIDAAWLTLAAGRPCYNLDSFMMTDEQIIRSFSENSVDSDLSLIEGNRGLYDGLDPDGCCSTAELAKLLRCPVVLIVDVTMVTRTAAALVLGCQELDRDLNLSGVILNRVAGPRQETLVRNSIEKYCGLPILGSVPKLKESPFPERHMGLVPHQERGQADQAIEWARTTVEKFMDMEALRRLAQEASALPEDRSRDEDRSVGRVPDVPPRIGYIQDRAFWFYYPENLAQLEKMGANLVKINALEDKDLPPIDALYIGGGFPETQARALADNRLFKESLKKRIEAYLPVYAECGGLLYMGENLLVDGNSYPMVGALPLDFAMGKRPQGHGYTILEVTQENPFYPKGEIFRGHEFHYSSPIEDKSAEIPSVFKVIRGKGLDGQRDGLCRKNLLATYTHIHAAGNTFWGENFYKAALLYKKSKK